jgi:hypothetical protein
VFPEPLRLFPELGSVFTWRLEHTFN